MKKLTKKLVSALILSGVAAHAAAQAQPGWVKDWQEFAAKSGNANHKKWVDLISDPQAVALAKEWEELRGYSASSLIKEADIPSDLKPGLVIDKNNMSQYPWLKDYLPKAVMAQLQNGEWFSWKKIKIVPSNSYYMQKGTLKQTKEAIANGVKFNATPEGNLLTPDGKHALATTGALPFIHPKNGLELNWMFIAHGVNIDNLAFKPVKFDICNSSNKVERQYEGHLFWQKFHGRTDFEPFGDVPNREGVVEGGAMFFTKPFDVRGLAAVRLRYADAKKDDDFKAFLPSLRRTRTLTGSDGQDPMAAGLEITWDEWRGYWVKTNPEAFEYKLVGDGFVLAQPETGHVYDPAKTDDSNCVIDEVEMELRPVWKLEIVDKKGVYQYSKRVIYIDKENYYMQHQEMYDKRGNLWRVWDDVRDFDPKTGRAMWKSVLEWNPITNRLTHLMMTSDWDAVEKEPTQSIMNIDRLRDYR